MTTVERRTAPPDLAVVERRSLALETLEVRRSDDAPTITFRGYASVTEAAYDVYGGAPLGFAETIARGAFKKTLSENPDVVFLVNHEGLPLARTRSGTMRLEEDNTGLRVEADLDPEDRDVQWILPKMERGDLTEMSFAFRVIRQEWDEDYVDRRITEVALDRGDVSVVRFGANPHTSGDVERSADDEIAAWIAENPERAASMVADARAPSEAWSLDYARTVAQSLRH